MFASDLWGLSNSTDEINMRLGNDGYIIVLDQSLDVYINALLN